MFARHLTVSSVALLVASDGLFHNAGNLSMFFCTTTEFPMQNSSKPKNKKKPIEVLTVLKGDKLAGKHRNKLLEDAKLENQVLYFDLEQAECGGANNVSNISALSRSGGLG
ncbi:MAG TPA: hypothetical protein VG754_02590 [Verrucomicrobiae bacterium]|nr:hypothetical protein [Verrucomicrobiae bacterium]